MDVHIQIYTLMLKQAVDFGTPVSKLGASLFLWPNESSRIKLMRSAADTVKPRVTA